MKRIVLALILIASALVLPAQEGLRIVTQLSASGELDASAWSDSLERALARSDRVATVIRAQGSAVEQAARLAWPLAIVVSVSAEGKAFVADWTLIHPASKVILAQGSLRDSPETEQIKEEYYWLGLLQAVAEVNIPGRDLTIMAAPGTLVEGFGEPLTIGESGSATIDVIIPAVYTWTARLRGFETKTGMHSALKAGEILTIPLTPLKRWTIEASLRDIAFPEVHVERSFRSNWVAARAGFCQRLEGLAWDSDSSGYDAPALRDSGLLEPGIGGLLYLREEGNRVRPYLAVDVNLRLCRNRSFLPDPKAPLRLAGSFGVDWRIWKSLSLYVEGGLDYFPWADITGMEYVHERSGVTATFPDGQFINLPTGVIGARYRIR